MLLFLLPEVLKVCRGYWMHLMLAISFPWLYYFYCWLFREPVILFNYSLLCRFMQVSSLISSICQWCTLVYQCNGKPPSSYLSRRFSNLQLLSITDQSPLGKGLISDQSPSCRSFHVCSSAVLSIPSSIRPSALHLGITNYNIRPVCLPANWLNH